MKYSSDILKEYMNYLYSERDANSFYGSQIKTLYEIIEDELENLSATELEIHKEKYEAKYKDIMYRVENVHERSVFFKNKNRREYYHIKTIQEFYRWCVINSLI